MCVPVSFLQVLFLWLFKVIVLVVIVHLAIIYIYCLIILQYHLIVNAIFVSHGYMLHLIECSTNCKTCADSAGTMTCTACIPGYALDSANACVSEYILNQYHYFQLISYYKCVIMLM